MDVWSSALKPTFAKRPLLPAYRLASFAALLIVAAVPASAAHKPKPKPLGPHWSAAWTTTDAPMDNSHLQLAAQETTLREIVHATLSGPLVRIQLSNEFGTKPLSIGSVHLALSGDQSAILLASANIMTFNGHISIVIPPGGVAVSDPAAMIFKPGTGLAVSIFLPAQKLTELSAHTDPTTVTYRVGGNEAGRISLRSPAKEAEGYFLKSVDIMVPGKNGDVGAFSEGANVKDAKKNPPGTQ